MHSMLFFYNVRRFWFYKIVHISIRLWQFSSNFSQFVCVLVSINWNDLRFYHGRFQFILIDNWITFLRNSTKKFHKRNFEIFLMFRVFEFCFYLFSSTRRCYLFFSTSWRLNNEWYLFSFSLYFSFQRSSSVLFLFLILCPHSRCSSRYQFSSILTAIVLLVLLSTVV